MSSAASSKRHANERAWLIFMATQHSSYVLDSVEWLKAEYPGSVDSCLPELRKMYAAAKKREEAALRKASLV